MKAPLIIFDLDGTLVDSERLCNLAFLDLFPDIKASVDEFVTRYRGRKLSEIMRDISQRYDIPIDDGFEHVYRARVAELFSEQLKPVDGVHDMLARLEFPICVASSGPPNKIKQALTVCGLLKYFDHRYYSSYAVNSWKPEPGLFLHAAAELNFNPKQCIVVEDSHVGIQAANAAGMRSLRYLPDHGNIDSGQTFSDMSDLPELLNKLSESDLSPFEI